MNKKITIALPAWLMKLLLFIVLSSLMMLLLGWRYHQLNVRMKIGMFFNNASIMVPFEPIDHMMTPRDQALQALKSEEGDLLDLARPHLLKQAEKYLRDPFPLEPDHPFLPLRYGTVEHNVRMDTGIGADHAPAWFTWSAGPSRKRPHYSLERVGDLNHYHFKSPVYDASNGLKSSGYLFFNSRGISYGHLGG